MPVPTILAWLIAAFMLFVVVSKLLGRISDYWLFRRLAADPDNRELQIKAAARHSLKAGELYRRGVASAAVSGYQTAVSLFQHADVSGLWRGGAGLGFGAALQGLAYAQQAAGDLDGAVSSFRWFLDRAQFENFDRTVIANGYYLLGENLLRRGRMDDGCQALRTSMERYLSAGSHSIPDAERVRARLEQIFRSTNRLQEANEMAGWEGSFRLD
ncbi:MAG: hypothetical protein ABI165_04070 [Bryobacteraceae bacterium]